MQEVPPSPSPNHSDKNFDKIHEVMLQIQFCRDKQKQKASKQDIVPARQLKQRSPHELHIDPTECRNKDHQR